jgi:DNA mismatch repair protein MutS2
MIHTAVFVQDVTPKIPEEIAREMDAPTLSALEYDEIVSLLMRFAASDLGKRECERLRPLTDSVAVERLLSEVTALKEVIEGGAEVPLGGVVDLVPILERARVEGAILPPRDLLAVATSARASDALKRFFRGLEGRHSLLKEIGEEFAAPSTLFQEIERAIATTGEIYDAASSALKAVRQRMSRVREVVQERLEALVRRTELQDALQDDVITQRNGRSVILIRADGTGRVKGIVHDASQSRASLYVEPLEVVELNNELHVLVKEEKEEEEKVLGRLSDLVRGLHHELRNDVALQGRVDAISAKARLSCYLHGIPPRLNAEGKVRLMAARHPLLAQAELEGRGDAVVPIDLTLDRNQRILVISGANTGGKTVALKTLGLLSLMAQAGLHIPAAADSELTPFTEIFAFIGDAQDLQAHLSTFSSFIQWLNRVLAGLDQHVLLLIDELGVGTEYSQGAALAMGLLDYLREQGCYAVVTSHFNPLKAYAYRHEGVVNVAVEFDQDTLQPTYRLLYGRPGTSQTLLIAERLGLTKEILAGARGYQDEVHGRLEELMGRLESLHHDLEVERIETSRVREQAKKEHERVRRAAEEIRAKKRRIVDKAEEDGKKIIHSLEARLREVLKKAEERKGAPSALKGEVKRIQADFKSHFSHERPRAGEGKFSEGDWVEVLSLGKEGVVLGFFPDLGRAEISLGGIRVKAPLAELRLIAHDKETERQGKQTVAYHASVAASERAMYGELNVIGLRVEEALPQVDKFLDDALLQEFDRVHIIHGIGSGRLREAIHGHLKGHQWIRGFRGGELTEGGAAVTIVELR